MATPQTKPICLRVSAVISIRLALAFWMPRFIPLGNGYALDTFQVVTEMLDTHYRELTVMVENDLKHAIETAAPLPQASRGRVSQAGEKFPCRTEGEFATR
jgi:UTP:GlnB (protein PII) uridylyltransferase